MTQLFHTIPESRAGKSWAFWLGVAASAAYLAVAVRQLSK